MKNVLVAILLVLFAGAVTAKDYSISSPDGKVLVVVSVDKKDGIFMSTAIDGKSLLRFGPLQMDIEGYGILGKNPNVRKEYRAVVDEVFNPVIREKRAAVRINYSELSLLFKDNFRLDFRVFDDGVAYRFRNELEGVVQVNNERVGLNFSEDPSIWFPTEESFFSHSERLYEQLKISEIPKEKFSSLPALVDREDGIKILFTEAHLEDYPGLYLQGSGEGLSELLGIFPAYVLEEKLIRDRDVKPVKRAEYIAKTSGTRSFPWRVAALSRSDEELIGNDIVLRLAPECRIENTSWIRPGIVAWDWWNANNNSGVPFRSGVNTETYKYHIDFAAEYGLEYVILDEGWSVPSDLFQHNPDCNMEELTAYAKEKGVDLILWVLWNALDKDLDRALDQFKAWGVKGIKIDFMQRDDQAMVNYYWKVAKAAAQRELLVDFHGSYKPTGIRRAYPNCVNREGLKGLENAKWSDIITPDHDCTLPFIRMVAGPMDYTPGAMRNTEKGNFHISFTRPVSQGTRAHQLALYVLFDSPIQMLCDAPSQYYRESVSMKFLAQVPSVWDETIPLFGKVGDYVGVARKSGQEWFIGIITDWTGRDFDIDLGFLGVGDFEITKFQDGINADRYAEDLEMKSEALDTSKPLTVHLAPGGGWVGIIRGKR